VSGGGGAVRRLRPRRGRPPPLRAVDAIARADVVIWSATQIERQVLADHMRPEIEDMARGVLSIVLAGPPRTVRSAPSRS
jgi:hypothetical protein